MSGAGAITGHGFPAIEPLVPTERIVIRDVADGAGPSHIIAIGPYLLVVDPWAAEIRRYALADMAAPPVAATMPRSFAPWRTRRSGEAVLLIAEPFGPEEDGSYHLRPRTMMTITGPTVAAMAEGAPCGFPIEACDTPEGVPAAAATYPIGTDWFATITPVGAAAEIHAVRHAGSLARGRMMLWWSEVDGDAAGRDDYAGRVTASQYVGIVGKTGGALSAIIRLQSTAYAPLVVGRAIPMSTLLVKPGFEYVVGATEGARDMLWVMAADIAATQSPTFVLLGYPLDALGEGSHALVSLVEEGRGEDIDRNDPTAAAQITVPTQARQAPVGPRRAWFDAARARLEQQIAHRWSYPEGARERPCGGADLCAIGANEAGALGVGDGFGYPVADKIDTAGGAQWMRPRQLIGVSAGEWLCGVPYSIGGFDLADSFAERVAAGYDGADPYPPPIGHIREGLEWPAQGRHYPLGIDCSALVARIFDIGARSTAEMAAGVDFTAPNGQTYQLPHGPDHSCAEPVRHLRDIQPGDLLLRDGHVVIFSGMMPVDSGRAMRVFEASSRTGRVCESVYDPTFFDGWWILRMRLDGEGDCPRWIDARPARGRG